MTLKDECDALPEERRQLLTKVFTSFNDVIVPMVVTHGLTAHEIRLAARAFHDVCEDQADTLAALGRLAKEIAA